MAIRSRVSRSSIGMSVHRGEQVAEREGHSLLNADPDDTSYYHYHSDQYAQSELLLTK